MTQVHANILITASDSMRVRSRIGGGFHVILGPARASEVMISFDRCATAEAFAALLTTSSITHGDLGAALAAVVDTMTDPTKDRAKPRLALVSSDPDQPPPRAA